MDQNFDIPPVVPPISPSVDVARAVRPLKMIFWGALLVVLDFRINGFDLLNDTIGMILITIAVFSLAQIRVDDRYWTMMSFVRIMSAVALAKSVVVQIPMRGSTGMGVLLALTSLIGLIATMVFFAAMRRLCQSGGLSRSARSWTTTLTLFAVIYLIPMGLFYAIALFCMASGKSFSYHEQWMILLIPVFLVPPIHMFVSTSRMKREAQAAALGPLV